MKYVRKVMALGLAIVFLIALVVGMGIIFSVRNVNVSYLRYSDASDAAYEESRANLNTIKGSSLLFIDEADISKKITDNNKLSVVSYEKKFPCTVNVVVKQRVECFAVESGSSFDIYDEDGKLIRSSASANSSDGEPLTLLSASGNEIKEVAALCNQFREKFGSFRRLVASVSAYKLKFIDTPTVTFTLRSGLIININDWRTDGEAKIDRAYEKYSALGDAEKMTGTITER
ncbi:MAG: hypothetical protein K2N47_03275 [Clostridia bacterium]|nr:hypothetical protein [Clostridia bacterium]